MPSPPTPKIALTPVLEDDIRAQVASGRYADVSEFVRARLRLLVACGQVLPHAPAEKTRKAR